MTWKNLVRVPEIDIENAKGLSDSQMEELKEQLNNLAKERIGYEVLYELAEFVRGYLHKYNRPQLSFYALMVKQQEDEKKKKNLEEFQESDEIIQTRIDGDKEEIRRRGNKIKFKVMGEERNIQIGKLTGKTDFGYYKFAGIDCNTGDIISLLAWQLKPIKSDNNSLLRQIIELEQEVNSRLPPSHPNIIGFLGVNHVISNDYIQIQVLSEHIPISSLADRIGNNRGLDLEELRYYTRQIMEALQFLHNKKIYHGYLTASCVHVDSAGEIKLSNYELSERFHSLSEDFAGATGSVYSVSDDIFRLGVLLLSLYKGQQVRATSRSSVNIPYHLPKDFADFLAKCFKADNRDTIKALLYHQFVVSDYKSLTWSAYPSLESKGLTDDNISTSKTTLSTNSAGSRLHDEFSTIELLGKGGFGDVMKVQKKLDGCYYAIKKIKLDANFAKKILQEVLVISRMHHENVVRYYNSWIETETKEEKESNSSNEDSTEDLEDVINVPGRIQLITKPEVSSSMDFIEFVRDDEDDAECEDDDSDEFIVDKMEYCEKNNLRTVIDEGIYKNEEKLWQYFGEIVQGLAYIHEQGILHRDLKPGNVFIDSKDQVKIGDFGLALEHPMFSRSNSVGNNLKSMEDGSFSAYDHNSGAVGTTLYRAPEITQSSVLKFRYDEKVDMYSLGIIFFEMCHPQFDTGMERYSVIMKVRQSDIILPETFQDSIAAFETKVKLIRMLLNHDPKKRPTARDLFTSRLIPSEVDDQQCELVIQQIVSNRSTTTYRNLIEQLFRPIGTPGDVPADYAYNLKTQFQQQDNIKFTNICNAIEEIFREHGAINVNVPLLMPWTRGYDHNDTTVTLIDESGTLVMLPRRLEENFARFVAHNRIYELKRYYIGKAYSKSRYGGSIPDERNACTFDIVSTTKKNALTIAEVICVASEVLKLFPLLQAQDYSIHLNHTTLLRNILSHCGIETRLHSQVIKIFSSTKKQTIDSKFMKKQLHGLGLSDETIFKTIDIMNLSLPPEPFVVALKRFYNERISEEDSNALNNLCEIYSLAQLLNVDQILISFRFTHGANSRFSGPFFNITYSDSSRSKRLFDIIASGGSYEKFIDKFSRREDSINYYGVTFSIDKMLAWRHQMTGNSLCDILIFPYREGVLDNDIIELAGALWDAGFRVKLQYDFYESDYAEKPDMASVTSDLDKTALAYCLKMGISFLVLLQRPGHVNVYKVSNELSPKTKKISDLYTFFMEKIDIFRNKNALNCKMDSAIQKQLNPSQDYSYVNVTFITLEKVLGTARKKYEAQIKARIAKAVTKYGRKAAIEIIATDLCSDYLPDIAEVDIMADDSTYKSILRSICEKHQQARKEIQNICDEIRKIKFPKSVPVYLYNFWDNKYEVLIQT
ncbi:uncharacterized protein TRIADDRAFT_51839 [Trichoplax adhaerens]|uniref:non-specific serine/threonine protein kinase n=1 Tax=Trichoplax adhaerens TaxID=10228 RepID=B3RL12_TRIAD|nr:hypothetical protein TRIADDRAFT_51839 [Trichoplax adhaerens]EDV29467.1 hypothetical protein TRIADDRAFT_51839 [Trichoplax adhaerens]|eukprot:XP_002108669.1 hypothetical protein TRIADDRAFT_51839 [Trichoplax adhaerens]